MKKTVSIFLGLALLLGMMGCSEDQSQATVPTTEPAGTEPVQTLPTESEETTAPTVPAVQYQVPLIAAATAPITEHFSAGDGTALLHYTYQDLMLTLPDPQVADAIVMDYLNLMDPASSTTEKVLRDAKQAYKETEDWSAYEFNRLLHPMRLDSAVLSFYGTQTLYSDSSHGTSAGISVTYDLVTGQQLSLKQILQEDFSADQLAQLITAALSSAADEGILYSDYAYVIAEMFSSNTPVESWYFSGRGLCFYFAPYEIAPYSAGTLVAEVPYDFLTDLLKDEYFPVEEIELSGSLVLIEFENADLADFTQFAELILDSTGKEYILSAVGTVKDLRVEYGQWQQDGSFIPTSTVFSSATLCQGDALVLQLSEDSLSQLRISYESAGETVFCNWQLVTEPE